MSSHLTLARTVVFNLDTDHPPMASGMMGRGDGLGSSVQIGQLALYPVPITYIYHWTPNKYDLGRFQVVYLE